MKQMMMVLAVCLSFAATAALDTVRVSNVTELIDSIRPNCLMLLNPGEYALNSSPHYAKLDENVEYSYEPMTKYVYYSSGFGVTVKGVKNLVIKGMGETPMDTRLITSNTQDHILAFDECVDIKLINIEAEHWPATRGGCEAGVWLFSQCDGVKVDKNSMLGSGNIGINGWRSKNISVTNSSISECSAGIVELKSCWSVSFRNCEFSNNVTCYSMWYMTDCADVTIESCSFLDNIKKERRACSKTTLFNFSRCQMVNFRNNTIKGNDCHHLANSEETRRIVESQSTLKRNKFVSIVPGASK